MGYTGGLEIAYQRWKKHISQEELAREIGCSQAAVALWESGKRTPSITAMIKMADYFDVSLDKFIERRTPDNTIGLAYSGRVEDLPFLNELREVAPRLNKEGQKKVIEYAFDLAENPKYAITSGADPEEQQPT